MESSNEKVVKRTGDKLRQPEVSLNFLFIWALH